MAVSQSPYKPNDIRSEYAKLAGVEDLKPFADLAMIDEYAQKYGKLPREVLAEQFDNFMPFFVLWNRQNIFMSKYQDIVKEYA